MLPSQKRFYRRVLLLLQPPSHQQQKQQQQEFSEGVLVLSISCQSVGDEYETTAWLAYLGTIILTKSKDLIFINKIIISA